MNTHPSPSNTTSALVSPSALRVVEEASRRLVRWSMTWGVFAVLAFVASASLPEGFRGPADFIKWTCLVLALVFTGRFMQNQRMLHWLTYQSQAAQSAETAPSWGEIPPASARLSVRSYNSVEEAKQRGWSLGETVGRLHNQDVPAWMEVDGERFLFDRQVSQRGVVTVAEGERLFGNLKYVKEKDTRNELPAGEPDSLS